MEPDADPQRGDPLDHLRHHVPRPGHDEGRVGHFPQDPGCRLDEVIRAFLEGDPAQEQNGFPPRVLFNVIDAACLPARNGIVDDGDFFRADPVPLDHDVFRVVADRDDAVGCLEAVAFDVVNVLIDVLPAAVELEGVDVEDEGPAADPCGLDAGKDGHPVVGVDDVAWMFLGKDARDAAVADHFRDQVGPIVSGNGHEPGAGRTGQQGRIAAPGQVGAENGIHRADGQASEDEWLFATRLRGGGAGRRHQPDVGRLRRLACAGQHEGDLMAQGCQGPGHAEAGRSQTAAHEGGKFPAEHQNPHGRCSPCKLPVFAIPVLRRPGPGPFIRQ